jgi:hypothetical protein
MGATTDTNRRGINSTETTVQSLQAFKDAKGGSKYITRNTFHSRLAVKRTDGTRDQSYTQQEGCAARSRQGSVTRVSKQRAHSVGSAAAAAVTRVLSSTISFRTLPLSPGLIKLFTNVTDGSFASFRKVRIHIHTQTWRYTLSSGRLF